MLVEDFNYILPPELIAVRPASPRESARLLVADSGSIQDKYVYDLPDILQAGDLLVFNDTKVIPARLFGKRGDVAVEVLLHKPEGDMWEVYARPTKRLKEGQQIIFSEDFSATVIGKNEIDGTVNLKFNKTADSFYAALAEHGRMPLPPYIERAADGKDSDDYQTIFAKDAGAVAAPTASLHYTPELLEKLTARGIEHCTVTLHVGAGTFMPVRVDDTDNHIMHSERFIVTPDAAEKINKAKKEGCRIIAVGTTALRTLESASDDNGTLHASSGETRLFITPGYTFKIVDMLLTNFHLPKSTLLMLVSAFIGYERAMEIYKHAISNGYRFYSYGDTSLLSRVR